MPFRTLLAVQAEARPEHYRTAEAFRERVFALLEPDQVTIVYPSGNEIRDQSYRLVQHPRISRDKLRAAMQEMSRFFK